LPCGGSNRNWEPSPATKHRTNILMRLVNLNTKDGSLLH
jgi:hypothetical protein